MVSHVHVLTLRKALIFTCTCIISQIIVIIIITFIIVTVNIIRLLLLSIHTYQHLEITNQDTSTIDLHPCCRRPNILATPSKIV